MADTVAILGGGKIGEALLSGLLRGARSPQEIVVSERYPERAEQLTAAYGVEVLDARKAVERATVVVVAVKPQDVDSVLAEISPAVSPRHVVVSVAAGLTIAHLEAHLPDGTSVVRCMPNTPALVDEGMTAISPGAHAGAEQLDVTEALLASVGKVVRVPESQLDAVTVLSCLGPAYFFLIVEAMIDAGVLLGLPRTVARELVVQTAVGSAVLLRESGEHPVQLREAVSSPAGTTVAAVRELEVHGVRAAVLAAAQAAARRAAELGASD
jgi:pyrroline-5-carboxylate reductase